MTLSGQCITNFQHIQKFWYINSCIWELGSYQVTWYKKHHHHMELPVWKIKIAEMKLYHVFVVACTHLASQMNYFDSISICYHWKIYSSNIFISVCKNKNDKEVIILFFFVLALWQGNSLWFQIIEALLLWPSLSVCMGIIHSDKSCSELY